jgi:hypothetical protein
MTRRFFLTASGAAPALPAAEARPKVACLLNAYYPNSHADVFMGRLLEGYRLNGVSHRPRLRVASFYVDQFPTNDMAREQGGEYDVPIYPSVREALCLGGSKLAVDGVAIIGEHGQYPRTRLGNFMYPRKKRFDEVLDVFERSGRVVPLMNDKYFAYDWADARSMFDRILAKRIPFFGGSSVPLTWRRPALDIPQGIEWKEVLAVSYSDVEEHAYHAIELIQAMAERRKGGETGVSEVRYAEGEAVWQDASWSRDLLEAAVRQRINHVPEDSTPPQAIFVRYTDGLRATILNLNSRSRDYLFAGRDGSGKQYASCAYIQLHVHNHWGFMVRQFEELVLTRRTAIPPARILLANGILLRGLQSRLEGGTSLQTPELSLRY